MLVSSFQQYLQTISPNFVQQDEIIVYNNQLQNSHTQYAFNNPINSQSRPITKLSSQVYENSNTPSSNGQSHYYQYQISPNSSTYQTSPILSSFSVSPSSSIEDTLCSISNQRPLRHEFQTKDQRKKQLPIRILVRSFVLSVRITTSPKKYIALISSRTLLVKSFVQF